MKAERPRTPFRRRRLAAAALLLSLGAAGNWVKFVASSRASEGRAPVPYNVVRRRITYY